MVGDGTQSGVLGGEPCRHCGGGAVSYPEAPRRDADTGVVRWVRVEARCRMCAGTGRQLHESCGLPPVNNPE